MTLTLLHDNDLHGHLFPFAYIETAKGKEELPSVIGAARRATMVRRHRLLCGNAGGSPLICPASSGNF